MVKKIKKSSSFSVSKNKTRLYLFIVFIVIIGFIGIMFIQDKFDNNKNLAGEAVFLGDVCLESVDSADYSFDLYKNKMSDAHGHYMPSWSERVLTETFSAGGFSSMITLGPASSLGVSDRIKSCAFIDMGSPNFKKLIEELKAGAICIGELSIMHFESGSSGDDTYFESTSPDLLRVYNIANSFDVPIFVHFDFSIEYIEEFKSALDIAPETNFIWAHMGDAPSRVVAKMLSEHPNLYVDISSRNPLCTFDGRLTSLSEQRLDNGDLEIKSQWKDLFEDEEYSSRILFGTDIGPGTRHEDIESIVSYFRIILGQINEDAQYKIAFSNAYNIFHSS